VIDEEILRNILLALVGVFCCTIVMILNVQVCFYILSCVLLTLVSMFMSGPKIKRDPINVSLSSFAMPSQISICGMMQLWGLTLDLVTCISLQLAVGLCVGECN